MHTVMNQIVLREDTCFWLGLFVGNSMSQTKTKRKDDPRDCLRVLRYRAAWPLLFKDLATRCGISAVFPYLDCII